MIRYVLLGLVQGLTEFLPVSSSGHLVLAERALGLDSPGVLLEAFLHLGTLVAVLWVFRRDILSLFSAFTRRGSLDRRKEVGLLLAGTIPIVLAGLLFRDVADTVFSSLWVVGGGLLLTAIALTAAARLRQRTTYRTVSFLDSLAIGVAQVLALFPGVSRSGITISAGVARRIEPMRAARFSFLLSIPALVGAVVLNLWDAAEVGWPADWAGIAVGTVSALVVGLFGIHALLAVVRRSRLWAFAIYCGGLGLAVLVYALVAA